MSAPRTHLMALTEGDFFRILPTAVAPCAYDVQANKVIVMCEQGSAQISISPEAPRKIASLCFPVLRVTIEFSEMSEQQSDAFLQRFDRAFHRGGG